MIDTTELEADIQARINALAGTESVDELFSLTSALRALTSKSYVSVATYADLPDLTTKPMPSGSLIFVQQLNILMMSVGNQWKGVDGRLPPPPVTAYSWGLGGSGQLGDNTTSNRSSPVTVVGGLTTWSQVSLGLRHSLGLTTAGIAYAWGRNNYGELGDNTTSKRSSPVTVIGGITNWKQLAAGYTHSLGVTTTGIAYAWGTNNIGQLGDGTTTSKSSPVVIVGGITSWSQVEAGDFHSMGLTTTGVVYAWGSNNNGQLGDNTITNKSSPVTVVGGITTWSQISSGEKHNLSSTSAGVLYAWGYNGVGQLGDNTITNKSSPVTVVGGITPWSKVSAGARHSLAIAASGTAYGWGRNDWGELGDNTTSSRSSPVTVVGGITNWTQVSASLTRGSFATGSHSLGLTSAGVIYSWGSNNYGLLGDGTTSSRSSPVTVVGGITTWNFIDTSFAHSVALKVG